MHNSNPITSNFMTGKSLGSLSKVSITIMTKVVVTLDYFLNATFIIDAFCIGNEKVELMLFLRR